MAAYVGPVVWSILAFFLWYGLAAVCTLIIFYTDITEFWIPDLPVLALALGNGAAWYGGLVSPALPAILLVGGLFLVLYAGWPGSMGSGDVKLALALCLGCTGYGAYGMAVTAFVLASMAAVGCWLWRRQQMIPFGPFLLLGWWAVGLGLLETESFFCL